MPAESLQDKAARLLADGRVHLITVAPERVVARVFSSRVYDVCLHDGRWSCSCPAADNYRECSHRAAVELVTVPIWARRRST